MTVSQFLGCVAFSAAAALCAAAPAPVVTLSIDGAVGPVTVDYVHHGLAAASKEGAQLVVGGVVAFVAGALMPIDTDAGDFGVPWPLVAFLAIVTAAFLFVVARMALQARQAPIASGLTTMIWANGEMLEECEETGWASIRCEMWRVRTVGHLARGQRIQVVDVDGALLRVSAVEGE